MTVELFLLLVLHTLAAARLTRLVFKDSLFETPRIALCNWLDDPVKVRHGDEYTTRSKWIQWAREKISYMITCPYCCSAYTSAGLVFAHRVFVDPVPMPVWWWLAVWMGTIVILEYTDSD